ncbi:GNAT family N-acetyltransferase [Sutcliffiella horikoshii]|uniref:GNAT family N-acetyltransferase n=1 Tax=Sutcliffiella horikoshii TaxID=79883 RepID=UPI0007D0B6BD|nr:GNAT family N-acetyltransferase [Sutcliffiella horikoshii]MCM3617134.1 GNAT family N-acetyltransferase [Sutcliffiella horikoshii]
MKETVLAFPSKNSIEKVATFIAMLNQHASSHIGYCGKMQEEIASSLKNDLTDVPFEKAFIVAYEGEILVGVIGFDADFENKSAEIWGPFIATNHEEQVPLMFEKMLSVLPSMVEKLCMFPNKENKMATSLAVKYDFSKKSEQAILIMERKNFLSSQSSMLPTLPVQFYGEMARLHDLAFPGTYYNGEQIIRRMNDHRKVFFYEKDDIFAGYIYVEVEPEFSEASIEFFAVDERFRGKGIGAELLNGAIAWIYSFKEMEKLQLCVDATNNHALKLYRKSGFNLTNELHFFEKKLKVHV